MWQLDWVHRITNAAARFRTYFRLSLPSSRCLRSSLAVYIFRVVTVMNSIVVVKPSLTELLKCMASNTCDVGVAVVWVCENWTIFLVGTKLGGEDMIYLLVLFFNNFAWSLQLHHQQKQKRGTNIAHIQGWVPDVLKPMWGRQQWRKVSTFC